MRPSQPLLKSQPLPTAPSSPSSCSAPVLVCVVKKLPRDLSWDSRSLGKPRSAASHQKTRRELVRRAGKNTSQKNLNDLENFQSRKKPFIKHGPFHTRTNSSAGDQGQPGQSQSPRKRWMDACRDPGDSEAELRAAGALRGTQQHRAASQTSLTLTDTALPTSGINQEWTELGTELQPPPSFVPATTLPLPAVRPLQITAPAQDLRGAGPG